MKNKDYLLREIHGKKIIHQYLDELNKLVLAEVLINDLLSLHKTDELKRKSNENELNKYFIKKDTLLFGNKEILKNHIENLYKMIPTKAYLFTEYSHYCGCIELTNLKFFNSHFEFNDEHSGIITILTEDLKNCLLLDFYEESNIHYLDIEIQGFQWSEYNF